MVELVVAAFLIVAFFSAVFEVNAICLRYVSAAKETVAAISAVNDRAEKLRNLSFDDLKKPDVISSLMSGPANTSDLASRLSEVVKISAYPTPNGVTEIRRASNGTITTASVATDLGSTLVSVSVSSTWNAVFGGRTRTEQINTVISNGTKK
jgi:hypothetical protein